jgi:formylglycine-generating enzyme required for sulfatase activity
MNSRNAVKLPTLFFPLIAFSWHLPATDSKADERGEGATPAANSMIGKEPGEVRRDNGLKMKLVWCPAGKFTMGSPPTEKDRKSREEQTAVTLTAGFWLGQFEVTQGQWEQMMGTTPWKDKQHVREGADYPVTYVSWNQAVDFCRNLTNQERKAGRLPSEWEFTLPTDAQWEYACRAGTSTAFSFGDDELSLSESAWWYGALEAGGEFAHEIGQKKANPWGLHDIHGNVWEWCQDWYEEKVTGGVNPPGPSKGSLRVYRGGSWRHQGSLCRSAYRWGVDPTYQNTDLGFRVVCGRSGRG